MLLDCIEMSYGSGLQGRSLAENIELPAMPDYIVFHLMDNFSFRLSDLLGTLRFH
jgi:hypothetical protein